MSLFKLAQLSKYSFTVDKFKNVEYIQVIFRKSCWSNAIQLKQPRSSII